MDITKLRKPNLSEDAAKDLILRLYGLEVTSISRMTSFNDQNYHVQVSLEHHNPFLSSVCEKGYTLKIINTMKSSVEDHFESMHSAMQHLDQKGITVPLPVLTLQCRTWTMEEVPLVSEEEKSPSYGKCGIHLLTYLPGKPLTSSPYSDKVLFQWGVLTAKIGEALKDFSNPALRKKKIFFSLEYMPRIANLANDFEDHKKQLVYGLLKRFSDNLQSNFNDLPKGFIHGDINGYNFLLTSQEGNTVVDGTLDFEDMHYGPYIWDVGFLMTHSIIGLGSSLDAVRKAGHALAGYQSIRPLSDLELSLLKTCIECRLCQSSVLCEYDSNRYPSNEHVSQLASDQKKWDLLQQLDGTKNEDLMKMWKEVQLQHE